MKEQFTISNVVLSYYVMIYCVRILNNMEDKVLKKKERKLNHNCNISLQKLDYFPIVQH